ncbi:Tyrosine-protein phosphatase non-receptor type 23 [Globodera pallida]|nr:Tyrosine-protein phosphatase non-receptor type 23 [Globodera pallida]
MEGIPRVPMVAPEMKVPSHPFPDKLRSRIKSYIAEHYQADPDQYDAALDELEQMRTGIPRVPMVAPEMKVPSHPFPDKLRSRIKSYIAEHYQADPDQYDAALDELEQMRTMISRCHTDVESICVAKRYYAQLVMMKKRFPMEEHDVLAVPFAWTDRMLDLMNQLCYEDVNFEQCCVLYNIGSAHAQIAASETRTEIDSVKNAFMHFQWAAWPMQQLRDQLGAARFSTCDFETPYLTFYLNVLLAQAQECMLEKSMIDQRKPMVVARVALHLYNIYQQCDEHLKSSGLADLLSSSRYKEVDRLCGAKSHLYGAISSYYLGQQADDEQQYGTRLAYFARALAHINIAVQLCEKERPKSALREAVQFAHDVIVQRESNVRKENDVVYHERVPRPDELVKLDGVAMVKPIGFDPCDPSIGGADLFHALLPIDVVKAVSMYSEEKDRLKRELLEKVSRCDSELENYLFSLKLDQLALDQPIDQQIRLPDELLAASAAFSAQPDAFPDLLDNFQRVTSTAHQADTQLTSLQHRMHAITNPFFVRDEGYLAIARKLDELNDHHKKARENNAELQRAIAAHSENLKLLSQPLPELTRQICGGCDFSNNPVDSAEGVQLRRITDKVDEMRKQRCKLVDAFRADVDADDITTKALAERELDPRKLFEQELHKHDAQRELIEQNLRAQDNICRALTDANADFADFRRQILETNEKRALHALTLVTAYQVFTDIVQKSGQAADFYAQLHKLLDALERGIANIETANAEFAREEQRKRHAQEERRRREAEVRDARRRQEEASHEAARAVNEFRFG